MNDLCERVRMAEMAALDGETPAMPLEEARAHQQTCAACREAVAQLRASQVTLARLPLQGPAIDLWPRLRDDVTARSRGWRREWLGVGLAASVLLVWRVAQLSADSPVPVALTVLVQALAFGAFVALTGDPLSIRQSISELKQEGVR